LTDPFIALREQPRAAKEPPRARPFTVGRLETMYLKGEFDQHFIRHDIDYSIEAALEMGRWEELNGYHSTYYIMERNPFYSVDEALFCMQELTLMGHDVGLHVDERDVPLPMHLWKGLKVSFHCPTPAVLWKDYEDFFSAYASKWRNYYVSDSNGRFRDGDPEDRPWFGDALIRHQINLHPEWWFEPDWYKNVTEHEWEMFFHGAPWPDGHLPNIPF